VVPRPAASCGYAIADTRTDHLRTSTTAGTITGSYTLPDVDSTPLELLTGPDNNLWMTDCNSGKITKIAP
jgi:hypothetical protein